MVAFQIENKGKHSVTLTHLCFSPFILLYYGWIGISQITHKTWYKQVHENIAPQWRASFSS